MTRGTDIDGTTLGHLADARMRLVKALRGVDSLRHHSIAIEGQKDEPLPCTASVKGWQIADEAVAALIALNHLEGSLSGVRGAPLHLDHDAAATRYAASVPGATLSILHGDPNGRPGQDWEVEIAMPPSRGRVGHRDVVVAMAEAYGHRLVAADGGAKFLRMEDGRRESETSDQGRTRTEFTFNCGEGPTRMRVAHMRRNT